MYALKTLSPRKLAAPVIALTSMVVASGAFAALDAAVSAELTTAKTDVLVVGGLVFAIAIGIVLFKWFKRAL